MHDILLLLQPGLNPCLIYAAIAGLHGWWALESHHPDDKRDHCADALLHGLLSIAHMIN